MYFIIDVMPTRNFELPENVFHNMIIIFALVVIFLVLLIIIRIIIEKKKEYKYENDFPDKFEPKKEDLDRIEIGLQDDDHFEKQNIETGGEST